MHNSELNQIVHAAPTYWQDFVRLFRHSDFQRLDIWYLNQKSSSYNVYPELQKLLAVLLAEDAFLFHDKLVFEPRLLRFEAKIQTAFLKFIVKYKEDIAVADLGKFVDFYEDFFKTQQEKPDQSSDDNNYALGDFQELAVYLTTVDDYLKECIFKETLNESDYDWIACSQDDILDTTGLSQSTRKRILTQRSAFSPISKRSNLDVSVTGCSQYLSQDTFLVNDHDDLSSETCQILERLKCAWLGGESTANTDDIRVFCTVIPEQIPEVCQLLDIERFDLESTCLLLKDVTCLVDEISYNTLLQFLTIILLPKIQNLEQNTPWLVVQSLIEFTKQFQTPVIESVCLPCLTTPTCGNAVGDLMVKMCKEALTSENKTCLLKLVADSGCEIGDVTISVLHMLCDSKIALEEAVMRSLLQCLEANSIKHSDNVKFGKLLLVIINKYGKHMQSQHLQQIQFITETQKYFFKKSILSAIKRLKGI